MKIKATYTKLDSGDIRATLTVIEKGDYPDVNIFYYDLQPSDNGYKLTPFGYGNCIGGDFLTDKEAVRWVEEQVTALSNELNRWRCAKAPDEQVYSI
ncbi:MAG: hypothetical protein SVM80_12675 [Halobacteriota archaeon]|nr:hypothetical protein [Halobacteriota archaeon]